MTDRGPDQDQIPAAKVDRRDPTYQDSSYLGTGPREEDDVQDLGFIVDDHDDRRGTLQESWQRLDDLDTDEPLEKNRSGSIPHEVALKEAGAPSDAYPRDFYTRTAPAEDQEDDFVKTSMLSEDPDAEDGVQDFTDETLENDDGALLTTSILGKVPGVADGTGSTLPIDLGSGGFQIEENPASRAQFDERLIAAREAGTAELDDYDDDKQTPP
jgi:hypothetical protein